MPAPILIRSTFWEGSDPGWTLAQVVGKDGNLLLLVDIDSVYVNVYETEDNTLIYGPASISKATVIFDTLQYAGTLWTEDDLGCNFAHYLADVDVFVPPLEAEGGRVYRLEYVIYTTTTNGSGQLPVVNLCQCRSMVQV